jgi:hypothetical protein
MHKPAQRLTVVDGILQAVLNVVGAALPFFAPRELRRLATLLLVIDRT